MMKIGYTLVVCFLLGLISTDVDAQNTVENKSMTLSEREAFKSQHQMGEEVKEVKVESAEAKEARAAREIKKKEYLRDRKLSKQQLISKEERQAINEERVKRYNSNKTPE